MSKTIYLFLVAIIIRLFLLGYFINCHYNNDPSNFINHIVYQHNDYGYFIQPAENFYKTGTVEYLQGVPFAGRMPGYWFPYLIIRSVVDRNVAITLLVVLQFLLSALSVVLLAKVAFKIFENKIAFWITYWTSLLSTFTSIFDYQTIGESFSVSAIIFFLYYLLNAQKNKNKLDYLLSGLFLTWAIFLRPFLGLLIIFIPIYILLSNGVKSIPIKLLKRRLIYSSLFVIPFVIAETVWISRNYYSKQEFIPLESGLTSYGKLYSNGWQSIRQMIYGWGEETAAFEPNSISRWIRDENMDKSFDFPGSIFKNVDYNSNEITELKSIYKKYQNSSSHSMDAYLDTLIVAKADSIRNIYAINNPFEYNVIAPIKASQRLIFKSGSGYLPLPSFSQMSFFQKMIKVAYSLLYYMVLFLGFGGIVLMLFKKTDFKHGILLSIIVCNLVLTLSIASSIQENRYFITAYPILIIGTAYLLTFLYKRFKSKLLKVQ